MTEAQQLILDRIQVMLSSNNLTVNDIPGISEQLSTMQSTIATQKTRIDQLKNSFEELLDITRETFYGYIQENTSEESAWEWLCDNVPSNWIAELDICEPEKYQIVEVEARFYVVIPNDADARDWQDYVETYQDLSYMNTDYGVYADDLRTNSLGELDTDVDILNSLDDLRR